MNKCSEGKDIWNWKNLREKTKKKGVSMNATQNPTGKKAKRIAEETSKQIPKQLEDNKKAFRYLGGKGEPSYEELKERFEKVYAKLPAFEKSQIIYVVPSICGYNPLTYTWKQINEMKDCKGKQEALKSLAKMKVI